MDVSILIDKLSECFSNCFDVRKGKNKKYDIKNIAMAAYSVFHMQSGSFLAHQKRMQQEINKHNGKSLFGFDEIPSDNHIRQTLDHSDPDILLPFFQSLIDQLDPEEWTVDGHWIIAIDGVTFHSSSKIHCDCCLKKKHQNGAITYSHAALCPVIVHPTQKLAIPLFPEFIQNQDGTDKQDCEINAAKRWVLKNSCFLKKYKVILLGDDLFSRTPFIDLINQISGLQYIFVAKPTSHSYMYEWLDSLDDQERITHKNSEKAYASQDFLYQFANDVPLTADENSPMVSHFDMQVSNKKGKLLYHNSFVTNIHLTKKNIHTIACIGRNRWKIENEAFNILKTKGYHLEHNFGHGKQKLANFLATLNIAAFAVHTIWRMKNKIFAAFFERYSSRKQVFNDLLCLTTYNLFNSWDHLLEFIASSMEKT